jgi:hypothetical protein
MTDIHTTVKENGAQASQAFDHVNNEIACLKSITKSTQSAIHRFQNIGQQVASLFGAFPGEIRDMLSRIVQGNFETYNVLLAIQRDIAAKPTDNLESIITVTDALNRVHRLPYEHFCNWDVREIGSPFNSRLCSDTTADV